VASLLVASLPGGEVTTNPSPYKNQHMQLPLNNVLVMIYYSRPLKAIEVLEIIEIATIMSYVENLIAKR